MPLQRSARRRSIPVIVGLLAAVGLPATVFAEPSGPNSPTTPATNAGLTSTPGSLTRTWVSSTGTDSHPCTRQAPCATFARAFAATANHGQIAVVDSGGYGPLTITRSVTIRAVGVLASIQPTGSTDGIVVDCADPTCRVVLDGLDLYGSPSDASSVDGVDILEAGAVRVSNSHFSGFPDAGIRFGPTDFESVLVIQDSSLSDNVPAAASPTDTGSPNEPADFPPFGLLVTPLASGGSGPNTVTIRRSNFDDNGTGIGVYAAPSQAVVVNVSNSEVGDSYGYGIFAAGSGGATVRLKADDITDNGTGVGIAASDTPGDEIDSFGNNDISGNTVDGNLTKTLSLRKAP